MKNLIVLVLTISLVFMSCSNKNDSYNKSKENENIFGVWFGWESELSESEIDSLVKDMAIHHISDVFLLVKGIAGTKFQANILTNFIHVAHENNLKVHLWYVINKDDVFISKHPDAHIYHAPNPLDGYNKQYAMDDASVNLLYPGYKQYVLDNIRYFISNFDCDGIHLDYIRYSHFVYSWDDYHLKKADSLGCNTEKLLKLFINDPEYYIGKEGFIDLYKKGDKDVVAWVNMRKQVIYDYIKAIKEEIDSIKHEIMLSAAFMPEGASKTAWADVQYSQDYVKLSPLLDMISPMAYFKDYNQNPDWIKTVTQKAISMVNPSCKICTGIQAHGDITANEIQDEIKFAKEGGAKGIVIYKYEVISDECWPVVDSLFSNLY